METSAAVRAPAVSRHDPRALDCPVCPRTGIPAEAAACPNCGADLMPVRRVRELPELYVNQALELASRGETDRAVEKLIAALELGGGRARIGLLAGKLLWRAGRGDEARRQWRAVLAEDPEQGEAAALLRMAGAGPAVHAAPWWLIPALCAMAVALIALLTWYAVYRGTHHHSDLEFAVVSAKTMQGEPAAAQAARAAALAEALQARPEFEVRRESGRLVVLFRQGLFGPGADRITGDPERRLTLAASLLAQYCRGCWVIVEGATDATAPSGQGRWKDNASLALARAHSAIAHLRQRSTGAGLRWMGVTAGESAPSLASTKFAGPDRSRTVVLHVWADSRPGH